MSEQSDEWGDEWGDEQGNDYLFDVYAPDDRVYCVTINALSLEDAQMAMMARCGIVYRGAYCGVKVGEYPAGDEIEKHIRKNFKKGLH